MSFELNRGPIGDHIHFSHVSDPKFKHNRLSVNFVLPLDGATAADYAVVPLLLRKGCRQCPDFTSLNARLAELYGATLDADVSKHGAYQVLEVSIRFLDNRFALEGEDLTAQCAALLASVVLDPAFDERGLFSARDVELERQFVIDTIAAEINDKRSYAVQQCVRTMCAGEPISVPRYGYEQTAKNITPQSATEAYRRMLKTAPIEIMFTGSGDPGGARQVFENAMKALERDAFAYEQYRIGPGDGGVKEKTETMDLNQGKMVLGMRTGAPTDERQVSAMRMFSAVFGGTPFSKLFLNVREKLSLCYYCASRYDVSTGLLLVDSGVDAANKQKAQDEILVQLAAIQKGDFDDEQLDHTKLLMKNAITSTTDSLTGIEGWYMAQILRGTSVTPAQDAESLTSVTKDEIIAAAKSVALDTVYFLTGNEKEGAE